MENKEVEKMLDSIKCEYALLEGKLYYQSKDVEKLLEDNQSLTKRRYELEQQLKAKNKKLDQEEKYKLALFMVLRNSQVMPKGIERGKTMKEINRMSINACRDIMASIDFDKARKEYDNGID